MKILGRIIVFGLTFFSGSQIVSLLSSVWPEIPNIVVDKELAENEKAVEPNGIHVMYAGMEPARGNDTAYLRFIIYNGTSGKVRYVSKVSEWPFPSLYLNGKKLPEITRCRSGMRSYSIEPGVSAEFRVGVDEFLEVPKKGDLITVGFYLVDPISHSYLRYAASSAEEFSSEPFVLPDSFRQVIRQWNRARGQHSYSSPS